jgi:DNA-binding NarL/FixJ family response regulator
VVTGPSCLLPLGWEMGTFDSGRLSAREQEILELARDGLTNREIAQRIALAEASVKGVIARLMRRFDCQNRLQLISRAQRNREEGDGPV